MTNRSHPRATSEALDAWVFASLPRAVAYAESLLNDRSAADDVVQDCYCRLLAKADVYDLPRDGTKILFRAITNACIDRNQARKFVSLDRSGNTDSDAMPIMPADPKSVEPSRLLLDRELEALLDRALELLPINQRAALQLKSLGHSLEEIAETLDVSAANAGVLIHRARKAVAAHLERYRAEPPS